MNTENFSDEQAVDLALSKYSPIQERLEIIPAAQLVRTLAPVRIAEVGTYRGGSLFIWKNAAAPGCRFIGVDTPGTPDKVLVDMKSWCSSGEDCTLILKDTKDPATASEAVAFLGGPIDYCFIDAAHDYASVSADFNAWEPQVRSGGMIGFHDIYKEKDPSYPEVWRLWAEIKARGWKCYEFFGPVEHRYGIGICVKP